MKKASGATIKIKMEGPPLQVMYRMSQKWAIDHQWLCIHGTPEVDFRAWINTMEGKAYLNNNSRGHRISSEIKEILIELTQQEIDARTEGQHLSIIEARIARQEHLKTAVGQAEHTNILMTREAEREVYVKRMQDGEDRGDENAIRRIEVLEAQNHRLREEVNRQKLIANNAVYIAAMEIKVAEFASLQRTRDWHILRKGRGHKEYLEKETEGCVYTALETPRRQLKSKRPESCTPKRWKDMSIEERDDAVNRVANLLGLLGFVVKRREPSKTPSSRTVSVATSRDEEVPKEMRKPRGSKSSKSSSSSSSSSKRKSDDDKAPATKKIRTKERGPQSSRDRDDGEAAAPPPLLELPVKGSVERPFNSFVAPSTRATTTEPPAEPAEAKARPTIPRPTTPVPRGEALKFSRVLGGDGTSIFDDTAFVKKPAQPTRPPPEFQRVHDNAPAY